MLRSVLKPKQRKSGSDFRVALTSWDTLVLEYERCSKEKLSDHLKIAIILEHAPPRIAESLRLSGADVRENYPALRDALRHLYESTREYSAQPDFSHTVGDDPMDVSAATKGKGKEKGKSKNVKFDGECTYCGKYGHRKADCRKRIADEGPKGGGRSQPAAAATAAASPGAGGTLIGNAAYTEPLEENWIFAVGAEMVVCRAGGPGDRGLVLGDSGADEHLCPPTFAEHVPLEEVDDNLIFRDVSGKAI
jgi:hypothetical protein